MAEHACVIGLLHHNTYTKLVTMDELKTHIDDQKEYNMYLRCDPLLRNSKELYVKEWSIEQYADKRRNTDLTRFNLCPFCGGKIEWKKERRNDR